MSKYKNTSTIIFNTIHNVINGVADLGEMLPQLELILARVVVAIGDTTKRKRNIIIMGTGKSGDVGRKFASTLSSYGTPAFFICPHDAMHGTLGAVSEDDLVIVISKSGVSDVLYAALRTVTNRGVQSVLITATDTTPLKSMITHLIVLPDVKELCTLNLAPTMSTILTMIVCDALAVAVGEACGITEAKFLDNHPSGELAATLSSPIGPLLNKTKVPIVKDSDPIRSMLQVITKRGLGLCLILLKNGRVGLITDGDVRRMMASIPNLDLDVAIAQAIESNNLEGHISFNFYTAKPETLVAQANDILHSNNISSLLVNINPHEYYVYTK